MRILFVISAFNVGGTEVKIKNVANYLVMNKLADVDILCLSNHIILSNQLLPNVGFSSIDATGGFWLSLPLNVKLKLLITHARL
ncbi:hypothetical protein D1115_17880 [Vibrio alfacsensis]|uniref:Glycosyltransferase n=1 Tax=Vibrio alfacsensis TaxID=1074311 RepID=A0ABM6YYN3_9VIBR|nr:hypothetical protein D1115_17880 [Vibrio alfacsensis]